MRGRVKSISSMRIRAWWCAPAACLCLTVAAAMLARAAPAADANGRTVAASDASRIVSIGGGHGLSALLHGLKKYTSPSAGPSVEVTAVVTVSDDGGSSGRLRRDFDILPPGDIRNCMVALSEDEALLSRLFQYRFENGRGLKGHSFGNLFLTALTHVTGDFHQAVKVSSEVLRISGSIYPATARNVAASGMRKLRFK